MREKTLLYEKKNSIDDKLMDRLGRLEEIFSELPEGKYEICIRKPKRTSKQNNSLHLYLKFIADILNNSGFYFNKSFLREGFDLEWNTEMVKEIIWRPVQKIMTKKESSTKLTTTELTKTAEAIQNNLKSKGFNIEFPSREQLMDKFREIKKKQ